MVPGSELLNAAKAIADLFDWKCTKALRNNRHVASFQRLTVTFAAGINHPNAYLQPRPAGMNMKGFYCVRWIPELSEGDSRVPEWWLYLRVHWPDRGKLHMKHRRNGDMLEMLRGGKFPTRVKACTSSGNWKSVKTSGFVAWTYKAIAATDIQFAANVHPMVLTLSGCVLTKQEIPCSSSRFLGIHEIVYRVDRRQTRTPLSEGI